MKAQKVLELLSCILITSMAAAASPEYIAKGPRETEEFEKGLYEQLPVYLCGIYPRDAILGQGVSEGNLPPEIGERMKLYKKTIETWLTRVLVPGVKPAQFNRDGWLGIRKLRWDMNYIVGKFIGATKQAPYKGAVVEFQANDQSMELTVTCPSLLTADANSLSDAKILDFTSKILNIPEEKVSKTKIEKHFITVAGIDVCNGKMLCEWDPKHSPPEEREWWSHIPFWYVKGKFVLAVSIVDWKQGAPAKRRTGGWKF